jgi:hypothetical protein
VRPGLPPGEPAAWPGPRHAVAARSYLDRLLGPERSAPAIQRAQGELATLTGGPGPADVAAARGLIQRAGFDALDAEARTVRRRILGVVSGHPNCTRIAGRLRRRADGQMPAAELYAFYRHLDRCERCATIAGCFDAAQWQLQVDLAAFRPQPARSPQAGEPDMPGDGMSPAPAPATASTRRRRLPALLLALAAVLIAGVILLTGGSGAESPHGPPFAPGAQSVVIRAPLAVHLTGARR